MSLSKSNREIKGICGIQNLGNTCYMNSALQCLAHSKEILKFFLQIPSTDENSENSNDEESIHQQIFKHFACFLNEIWVGDHSGDGGNGKRQSNSISNQSNNISPFVLNPSELRKAFCRYYRDFDNYLQHDAHEFLTYLLDSLHNALNRVENKSGAVSSDVSKLIKMSKTLSSAYYNSHKSMNDSIITDIFYGQLKSVTQCPECLEVNSTFDPFSSLGLSIPNEYTVFIYLITRNKNYKMYVNVNDNMMYYHLALEAQKQIDLIVRNYVFYFVLGNQLVKVVDNQERVGNLMKNRPGFLFMYENPPFEDIGSLNICFNFATRDSRDCLKAKTKQKKSSQSNSSGIQTALTIEDDINSSDSTVGYKLSSFPRVHKFPLNSTISNVLDFLKSEAGKFSMEPANELLAIKSKQRARPNGLFIRMDLLKPLKPSSPRSSHPDLHECKICKKAEPSEFICCCITNALYSKRLLSDFFHVDETLEINIIANEKSFNTKQLNQCIDLTANKQIKKQLTLSDLLDFFTAEEKVLNYQCTCCGNSVKASKKLQINRFPEILVIQLKRFKYEAVMIPKTSRRNSTSYIKGEKNQDLVLFDKEIELSKFSSKSSEKFYYELYGIINHVGKISGGHYTAICRHNQTGQWIEFDDRVVRVFDEDFIRKDAYLLFFQRRNK